MSREPHIPIWNIHLLHKTATSRAFVVGSLHQEVAATQRDGVGGWSVLEIVYHLRDYDDISRE